MKKQFYRAAAASVLGLSLLTGAAAADNSGHISGPTGPNSYNKVTANTNVNRRVTNTNNVSAYNSNSQTAYSGRVEVEHNTTAGNAMSGAATNANSTNATLNVNNAPSSAAAGGIGGGSWNATGTISGPTGPDSVNVVKSNTNVNTSVSNTNNLSVTNTNYQQASSGSAEVEGNTTGGSAVSGNASNTNNSTFSFNVTN